MESLSYIRMKSPVGELLIAAGPGGLCHLSFQEGKHPLEPQPGWRHGGALVEDARAQLREYFARRRRAFDLPLSPSGTPFQLEAWQALLEIPHGETRSYGEQARSIGRPGASRAVGAANGRNPIAIIIPCHRVIGARGELTGFGGGLGVKEYLLDLESARKAPAGGLLPRRRSRRAV